MEYTVKDFLDELFEESQEKEIINGLTNGLTVDELLAQLLKED